MPQRELLHRLRSVRGHIAALTAMIERDDECRDVLRQLHAVHGAMRAINSGLLRVIVADDFCGLTVRDKRKRAKAWRVFNAVIKQASKS